MTIQAECGGCGQVYLVDESKAGRSGKCKECGATFQVPALTPSPKTPQPPKQTQPAKPALPPKPAPKSRPQPAPKAAKPPRPREDEYEDFGDLPPLVRTGKSSSSGKKRRSSRSGFRVSFNWGVISKVLIFLMIALCAGGGVLIVPAVQKARQAARLAAEKKATWSNFSFPGGKFSCEMPEGAEYQSKVEPNGVLSQMWVKKIGRIEVNAGFADLTQHIGEQFDAEPVLAAPAKGLVQILKGGQLVSDNAITIQGNPAHEFVIRGNSTTILGQTIYANQRLLLLLVVHPTNDEPLNLRRTFETLKIE